jgi:hypothetical protein
MTDTQKQEKIFTQDDVKELIEQNRKILGEFAAFRSSVAEGNKRSPIAKEIKQRTCTIMFVDEKPVISLENKGTARRPLYLYEKQDPNRKGEYFLYADVNILDGVNTDGGQKLKKVTLDWNDFLQNADREECKIIEVKKIPWQIVQGTTLKQTVDPDYKVETEGPVDVTVEGFTQTLTVQLPNGEKIEIDEGYVNMSK